MDIREDSGLQTEVAPPVGLITTPLNPQPEVKSAPLNWSLWLLPLAAIMFVVGAIATYYLPTNMDLLLPLGYWLLVATALLVVVAVRMIPILTSPSNDAVRHRSDGTAIIWNRFASLTALLLASILVAALATGGILAFALNSSSIYLINREIEQPFVLAATSAGVTLLLLFAWVVRITTLQKLFQFRFAAAGVLTIPIVAYLVLNSLLPSVLYDRSAYIGSFASWPSIVQFARHEAERIDKNAILYDISTTPAPFHGPYSPQTTNFYVDLRFVTPSNEGIEISLIDTGPARLLYVYKSGNAFIRSYKYAQESAANWLAYLELGPREVYSLTEEEALAFAQSNNIDFTEFYPGPATSLVYNGAGTTQYGATAVWDIHYIASKASASLDLYVDGTTGEVLARRPYLINGTATPAPQPSTTASPAP